MKKRKKSLKIILKTKPDYILLLIALLVSLIIIISHRPKAAEESTEPKGDDVTQEEAGHEGHTKVFNGEKDVWIIPEEEVPVNDIKKSDFTRDEDGALKYIGTEYEVHYGIDVSKHQSDIDWVKVKNSGIDFAILRAGGRYYSKEGDIFEDENFKVNLKNAENAGVKAGVYFFSQAVTEAEAKEEADFVIKAIGDSKTELPVFFDWERISNADGRANDLDSETLTNCAIAFCKEIEKAGLEAGIYFNLDTSYYGYEMSRLTDYTFWCASPGDYPYCYYAHSIWQYSFEGKVPGINYDCDLNMMFIKK